MLVFEFSCWINGINVDLMFIWKICGLEGLIYYGMINLRIDINF